MRYSEQFFEGQSAGSRESAQVVAPIILELAPAERIVDVGCGVGTWLSVFASNGVQDGRGYDGDYVERDQFQASWDWFRPIDLVEPPTPDETYDLAVSLEVGEHLPTAASSRYVEFLTSLAPVVVFSAAIPLQGGTNHVNEQWPSFWASRFADHGYVPVDAIRPRIWHDDRVRFWYRQNMLFYVQESALSRFPRLAAEHEKTDARMLEVVHPELLQHRNSQPLQPPLRLATHALRLGASRVKRVLRV